MEDYQHIKSYMEIKEIIKTGWNNMIMSVVYFICTSFSVLLYILKLDRITY